MQLYGSASAEPFFVAPFPENWGARLRISGGCPARGEPEALVDLCSSIACRAQPCQRCSPVQQALILSQYALLRLCFGRAVFCCPFPGKLGSTTAHLRRLPRKGRAGGAQNLCSSIACRAQPCQRCTPVLQALICFRCIFTALLRQSRFCLLRSCAQKGTPPRLWAGGVLL